MEKNITIVDNILVRYRLPEDAKQIIIPDGVVGIGRSAFFQSSCGFWTINNPVIPPSVLYIGEYAFSDAGLTILNIDIPGTVREIHDFAFSGKSNIYTVKLNEGLERIGSSVFSGQKKLKELYLPTTLSFIADDAFENCSKQLKLYVAAEDCYAAQYLKDHDYTLHLIKGAKKSSNQKQATQKQAKAKETKALDKPEASLSTQEVDQVETIQIQGKTFVHTGFSKKDGELMESKITQLGGICRSSVSNQTDYLVINLKYTQKITTKYRAAVALREKGSNEKLRIISSEQLDKAFLLGTPAAKAFIDRLNYLTSEANDCNTDEFDIRGDILFKYNGNRRNITIPDGVVELAPECFINCSNIRNVTMPNTVRRIGKDCFFGCLNMGSIILSESLEEIGSWAFADCNNLKEIIIPEGVTSIKKQTFGWCYALSKVTLPASISSIADLAFGDPICSDFILFSPAGSYANEYFKNSSIKNVATGENNILKYIDSTTIFYETLSADEVQITHVAFDGKAKEIILPDYINGIPVTSLGRECFYQAEFKAVKLPRYLKAIGNRCFYECMNLEHIAISDTVIQVGDECFDSCKNLVEVCLSSNLKEIPTRAFWGCSNLKKINIPESVEKIGVQAFRGCSALEKIDLSENLCIIESSAFEFCDELTISCMQDGLADQYAKLYQMKTIYTTEEKGNIESIKIHRYTDSWGNPSGGFVERMDI